MPRVVHIIKADCYTSSIFQSTGKCVIFLSDGVPAPTQIGNVVFPVNWKNKEKARAKNVEKGRGVWYNISKQ